MLSCLDHISLDCFFQVGQYFVEFWYVIPVHESKFPVLIAFIQVYRTGNPAAAWKYRIRSSTLGEL